MKSIHFLVSDYLTVVGLIKISKTGAVIKTNESRMKQKIYIT